MRFSLENIYLYNRSFLTISLSAVPIGFNINALARLEHLVEGIVEAWSNYENNETSSFDKISRILPA
jgi:hypothetical protein